MIIFVARQTFVGQAQQRVFPFPEIGTLYIFRTMALTAVGHAMFPFQFIGGQVVIEFVLIKSYHIKFSSMVFAVAYKAVFAGNRWVAMVTTLLFDKRLNFLVTLKTFCIRYLISEIMA